MIRKNYYFNEHQKKIVIEINSLISNNLDSRNCLLCNQSLFKNISSIDRYGIDYYTGICKNCG